MKTLFGCAAASSRYLAALLLILVASLASAQSSPVFIGTSPLNTGRYGLRAIPLNDGTILITGGYNVNQESVASSELYDPAAGVFTTTGSLSTGRIACSISLLDDGTVLVTGGHDNQFNGLASAEIYDPATGIFTTTGSLNTGREGHTATRLSDGTVLIAGGIDSLGNPLSSAEVYNPSTGTFSVTGSLNTPRTVATATALLDGTVLVSGGLTTSGVLASPVLSSAEIYDPATQSFTATGSLGVARFQDTATLLNGGSVLIAGGQDVGGNRIAQSELYDPASGMFTLTGSLNTARDDHAATLLTNGTVLVEGGRCQQVSCPMPDVQTTSSAEIYDPASGVFTATTSMFSPHSAHTATVLSNGNVLVAGGWKNTDSSMTEAELYQPGTLAPDNLASISLSPVDPCLSTGTSQAMAATGTFGDASTQILVSAIWSSSDTTIATITNDSGSNSGRTNDSTNSGVVYGVNAGSATLSACTGLVCGSTTVTVSSTCGAAASTARVQSSSLEFAGSVVGERSLAQTIAVTNTGRKTLSFGGIRASGDFAATSRNCRSIPSSGTCAVRVTFAPTSAKLRTGGLSLDDSADDSPQTITLTGSGIDFGLSVKNPSATVAPGSAATYQLRINSFGGILPSSVNLTCSNVPPLATCRVDPASVSPGSGSSTVTVRVTTATPRPGPITPRNERHPVATPPGTYRILVNGKSGPLRHVVKLILRVR